MSPATLKKYGVYAFLSFSLSLNLYFIHGNSLGSQMDRIERNKLEDMLIEQRDLQREQGKLLRRNIQLDSIPKEQLNGK